MHPAGIVALVMWLILAFGALSGVAFWMESQSRTMLARAYREVLLEKGMMKPNESVHTGIARARRASGRPRRLQNLLGVSSPPLSMESPPPPPPPPPQPRLVIARSSVASPHPPPLPPLPRIAKGSRS